MIHGVDSLTVLLEVLHVKSLLASIVCVPAYEA